MSIIDRLENLTDEQKIYLLQIVEDIRKIDDFAKNYPFKDDSFEESDSFYNIDVSFCMYSYSEDELLDLLASDGKLIKRPLLVDEKKVLIGFKEDEYKQNLL